MMALHHRSEQPGRRIHNVTKSSMKAEPSSLSSPLARSIYRDLPTVERPPRPDGDDDPRQFCDYNHFDTTKKKKKTKKNHSHDFGVIQYDDDQSSSANWSQQELIRHTVRQRRRQHQHKPQRHSRTQTGLELFSQPLRRTIHMLPSVITKPKQQQHPKVVSSSLSKQLPPKPCKYSHISRGKRFDDITSATRVSSSSKRHQGEDETSSTTNTTRDDGEESILRVRRISSTVGQGSLLQLDVTTSPTTTSATSSLKKGISTKVSSSSSTTTTTAIKNDPPPRYTTVTKSPQIIARPINIPSPPQQRTIQLHHSAPRPSVRSSPLPPRRTIRSPPPPPLRRINTKLSLSTIPPRSRVRFQPDDHSSVPWDQRMDDTTHDKEQQHHHDHCHQSRPRSILKSSSRFGHPAEKHYHGTPLTTPSMMSSSSSSVRSSTAPLSLIGQRYQQQLRSIDPYTFSPQQSIAASFMEEDEEEEHDGTALNHPRYDDTSLELEEEVEWMEPWMTMMIPSSDENFVQTVAAIVIQTCIRRFLAIQRVIRLLLLLPNEEEEEHDEDYDRLVSNHQNTRRIISNSKSRRTPDPASRDCPSQSDNRRNTKASSTDTVSNGEDRPIDMSNEQNHFLEPCFSPPQRNENHTHAAAAADDDEEERVTQQYIDEDDEEEEDSDYYLELFDLAARVIQHVYWRWYDERTDAAMVIQKYFRGYWVRDCIAIDHYCATVIQAFARGYIVRIMLTEMAKGHDYSPPYPPLPPLSQPKWIMMNQQRQQLQQPLQQQHVQSIQPPQQLSSSSSSNNKITTARQHDTSTVPTTSPTTAATPTTTQSSTTQRVRDMWNERARQAGGGTGVVPPLPLPMRSKYQMR